MVHVDAIRDLPRNWRIVAGLAVMYVWTWLHYWGGAFSLRNLTIELTNARWGANVAMIAVVVGLVAWAAARWQGRRLMEWLRMGSLASGLLGTALALVLVLYRISDPSAVYAVAIASGVFTGVCEGCLLALWCTVTSSLGVRVALTYNVLAMAASGALFLLCNLVPPGAALVIGMLCPVAGYLCSFGRARYVGAFLPDDGRVTVVDDASAALGAQGRAQLAPAPKGFARIRGLVGDRAFIMLALISFIFGFSSGFMNASFEVVPQEHYWLSCYGVVVGTILAAALTFLAAFVLKMDAWQLVFRTSLPLMAIAYLLFPYDLFWFVGPGIHALGYQYFFITFWSLLGSKQLRRDTPAVCSVSLGLFATEGGAALGLLLWDATCVGIGTEGLRAVSSVAAFLIVVAAVSLERPQFGWGNVRPGTTADLQAEPAASYGDALLRIKADYGLSPREVDVCSLLGRGRNRQFVADELGISLETAKTHATNVYRKLGIHSQQELLDVIETTCDTLARERGR